MNCPYVVRRCTKCQRILVVFCNFCKKSNGKYKHNSICKQCVNKKTAQTKESRKIYKAKYYIEHQEKLKKKSQKYRDENKEQILLKQKEKYKNDKEYREDIKKRVIEYRRQNPQVDINHQSRRKELIKKQGRGITKEQWYEMMDYFQWRCAYSDIYIGSNSKHRTIDHVIPIDKGGLNEIWNLVPCFDSYNYSKHTRNMLEWYQQQDFYSEERLQKIYEWQEYAYNKWGKEDEV